MPHLKRTRRISGDASNESFVGTDFSYNDMTLISRKVNKDNHAFASPDSAAVDGVDCYVIVSTPKDDFQYQKMVDYVGKTDKVFHKLELYKRANDAQPEKILELKNYADVQGHRTPKLMKITTVDTGSYTTITMRFVKYDVNIDENRFNASYMGPSYWKR
jgi:hypothetical protein